MAGGRSFYKVEEAIGPGVGDFVFAIMLWFVERVGKLDDFEVAFVPMVWLTRPVVPFVH